MNRINYSNSKYPVRTDYMDGHNRYWKRLAAPGNWLTSAQRVAVAKEVRQARNCQLCAERKSALSPFSINGKHDSNGELSELIVDVVHRFITDPARLTKTWFDGVLEQGLLVEEYVEILGTVVHVFAIDEFCRALDIPLNKLPEPQVGKPGHYRPSNVIEESVDAWVPMLPRSIDTGPEADLWEGMGANVIRGLSLVPDEVRSLVDLIGIHYAPLDKFMDLTGSPFGNLTRFQIELVGTRVSSYNDCFY